MHGKNTFIFAVSVTFLIVLQGCANPYLAPPTAEAMKNAVPNVTSAPDRVALSRAHRECVRIRQQDVRSRRPRVVVTMGAAKKYYDEINSTAALCTAAYKSRLAELR